MAQSPDSIEALLLASGDADNSVAAPFLADQLSRALSRALIEDLSFGVRLDGKLAIATEYDPASGRVGLSIRLDAIDCEARDLVIREFLAASGWIGAGGGELCLQSTGDSSLKLYTSPITQLDDPRLTELSACLLALAERWHARVVSRQRRIPRQGDLHDEAAPAAASHQRLDTDC